MTGMRIALDTNILVYAQGVYGSPMRRRAVDMIRALPADLIVIPAQSLGELFNVLVRKGGYSPQAALNAILNWHTSFAIADTTTAVVASAADIASKHQLSIWDSVILAASASAGCRLLLSEDPQDGFTWTGLTVANPFASRLHPLLAALLQ
jgi:predicted nucleic acid-binding protein